LPEIGRIQSTNFQSLLTELGITRNTIPFALRSEVTPVVLVGGTVSFLASPTPPYAVTDRFSLGLTSAPVINTVLADTGQLPIGAYTVQVVLYVEERAFFEFEWRDALNVADLTNERMTIEAAGGGMFVWNNRFNILNDNERFRILNVVAGGVGAGYQATIFAKI